MLHTLAHLRQATQMIVTTEAVTALIQALVPAEGKGRMACTTTSVTGGAGTPLSRVLPSGMAHPVTSPSLLGAFPVSAPGGQLLSAWSWFGGAHLL